MDRERPEDQPVSAVRFGVVVLCAGGTPRGGRHPGLAPYLGRTLVEHAARTALASGAAEVVVVLGDEAAALRERLAGLDVRIVVNRDWAEGLGGSIRTGVAAISPGLDGAVIALGDQPRITSGHLRALAEGLIDAPIVASRYDGIFGAPCAFARSEFASLLDLRGEQGARTLLRRATASVVTIDFAWANVEVEALLPDRSPILRAIPSAPRPIPARTLGARAPPRFSVTA